MMPSTRLQKIATTIPMMTNRPPREIPATRVSYPVEDRWKRAAQVPASLQTRLRAPPVVERRDELAIRRLRVDSCAHAAENRRHSTVASLAPFLSRVSRGLCRAAGPHLVEWPGVRTA